MKAGRLMQDNKIIYISLVLVLGATFFGVTRILSGVNTPSAYCTIDYFTPNAPIKIDGNLNDWQELGLEKNNISDIILSQRLTAPDGETDLSGEFQFAVDSSYLYVAVTVHDDSVITAMEKPIKGYENDSVGLRFGYKESVQEIRIGMSEGKSIQIYGYPDSLEIDIPYFWDAYGATAGFKVGTDGYMVEAAIPYTLLSWLKLPKRDVFTFNVSINDNDHDNELGTTNHRISWASGTDINGIYVGSDYRTVSLGGKIKNSSGIQPKNVISGKRAVELGLVGARLEDQSTLMADLLKCFGAGDWKKVLEFIEPQKEKAWTKPLQIMAYLHVFDFKNGFALIDEVMRDSKDEHVRQWAKECLFFVAEEWLTKKQNDNYAVYLLLKYNETGDKKLEVPMVRYLGVGIENMGYREKSRMVDSKDVLQEIENSNLSGFSIDEKNAIMLSVAKSCFYLKDYKNAERIAKKLSLCSGEIGFKARMLIESVIVSRNETIAN